MGDGISKITTDGMYDPEVMERRNVTLDRIARNKGKVNEKTEKVKTLEDELFELDLKALNSGMNFREVIVDFIKDNYTRK